MSQRGVQTWQELLFSVFVLLRGNILLCLLLRKCRFCLRFICLLYSVSNSCLCCLCQYTHTYIGGTRTNERFCYDDGSGGGSVFKSLAKKSYLLKKLCMWREACRLCVFRTKLAMCISTDKSLSCSSFQGRWLSLETYIINLVRKIYLSWTTTWTTKREAYNWLEFFI